MATLRVLNGSGDRQISWSATGLAEGDPEAQSAVREAEQALLCLRELFGEPPHRLRAAE